MQNERYIYLAKKKIGFYITVTRNRSIYFQLLIYARLYNFQKYYKAIVFIRVTFYLDMNRIFLK